MRAGLPLAGPLTDGQRHHGGRSQEEDAEGECAVEDECIQASRVDQLCIVHAEHRHQPGPGPAAGSISLSAGTCACCWRGLAAGGSADRGLLRHVAAHHMTRGMVSARIGGFTSTSGSSCACMQNRRSAEHACMQLFWCSKERSAPGATGRRARGRAGR